jgi:DNA-binding NarL/FixJ family response regulator
MRVVIADDHTLVRTGLRLLIESLPGIAVAGEAADAEGALRLIEAQHPDVALMDMAMPGIGGLEAVRRASARYPETRLLVLSMHAEEGYVQQALAAGAAGYLLKGAEKEELEHALRVVARGQTYISPAVSHSVVAALRRADTPNDVPWRETLTPRQREVLRLVAEGCSTKQVAARLHLSTKTVEAHRAAIMDRLGIRDLAGLVRFAIRVGLIDDGPHEDESDARP